MNNKVRVLKSITALFAAFGQANDAKRIEVYVELFKDINAESVSIACKKAVLECKFMPTIAELTDCLKELAGAADETKRVKTWEEAWREIQKAMYATPLGKTPVWSTPEIEAAVNAFGWHELHTALQADMSTIRAQIRRFYEDACERIERKTRNEALLGVGGNILGISESKPAKQLPNNNDELKTK